MELGAADVLCLKALGAFDALKLDRIAFVQRTVTSLLDDGVVHKDRKDARADKKDIRHDRRDIKKDKKGLR